jgi:hypothetical protein
MLMSDDLREAVLLVCADHDLASDVQVALAETGLELVGPAPTAEMALTLAGLTVTRTALLIGELGGEASADELAAQLSRLWGIDCYRIAEDEADRPLESSARRGALLRRALAAPNLRRVRTH